MSVADKRIMEKEALGLAITATGESNNYESIIRDRINTEEEFDKMPEDHKIIIGGEITSLKEITTKRGDQMAFSELTFQENIWNMVVFPGEFRKFNHLIKSGNVIMAKGKKSNKGSTPSIIVERIVSLEQLEAELKNR
jgi:DNA polymerase-3 subunit alpha